MAWQTLLCFLQAVRTRFQLHKSITPDYYGFRDEEDGVLLAVEAEAEATILAQVSSLNFQKTRRTCLCYSFCVCLGR
jgi:hypothetical protein